MNGHFQGVEDLLDRVGNFLTDTITGDEGDSVLAAKLGRQLKDGVLAFGLFIRFEVARVARLWKAEQCRRRMLLRKQLTLFSSTRVAMVRATGTRYGGGRQVMAGGTQVGDVETLSALFIGLNGAQ